MTGMCKTKNPCFVVHKQFHFGCGACENVDICLCAYLFSPQKGRAEWVDINMFLALLWHGWNSKIGVFLLFGL